MFITFEGVEGAGKSTQIKLLQEYLQKLGRTVVLTREPGGSSGAEQIRELLVKGDADMWTPVTELLLMNAARADHIERTIKPAIAAGSIVLCDRFYDSTRAYQGAAAGINKNTVQQIEEVVVMDMIPDITFIFDLSAEEGLARAKSRGGDDRFEKKGLEYHENVRQGFLDIANSEPDRCVVLNANQPIDKLFADLIEQLQQLQPSLK